MTITALLMLVSFLVENLAVLEQSAGSTMPKTPPLNVVLKFANAKRVVTWHGAFGAPTAKPLQIWSNSAIIEKLRREKPVGISGHLCSNVGGDSSYSGIPRRLFGSQAYTAEFGRAVADMMRGAH